MMNLHNKRPNHSKAPYRKPEAVKELEKLATDDARLKHPTLPEYALIVRKFRDDTANSLTSCIVTYITLKGGFASRINNTGMYRAKLGRYTPGTSCKGLADVMATYRGLSFHIEIKIGKDKQSDHQKQIELQVNNSGGFYYLARNFTDFKAWLDSRN